MTFTDPFDNVPDPVTGEAVFRCWGPDKYDTCPHADKGGVVACAGQRIAPFDAEGVYWLMEVPKGSVHCPLSWPMVASY